MNKRFAAAVGIALALSGAQFAVVSADDCPETFDWAGPSLGATDDCPDRPTFGGGGGGGSDVHNNGDPTMWDIRPHAESAAADLNTSNESEVEKTSKDISGTALDRVRGFEDKMRSAPNLSAKVYRAYNELVDGGNVSHAERSSIPATATLGDAVVDLHERLNASMTEEEKLNMQANVTEVPLGAAEVGKILIYATIDAMDYLDLATQDMNGTAFETVLEHLQVLSKLPSRANLTEVNGTLTASYGPNTTRALDAVEELRATVNLTRFVQATEVMAKGVEASIEVAISEPDSVTQTWPDCSSDPLIFAIDTESLKCGIVIGPSSDTDYEDMRNQVGPDEVDQELNVVLVDFGGNDTYRHAAGGGIGVREVPPEGKRGCIPFCKPVQLLADLEVNAHLDRGHDVYNRNDKDYWAAQGGAFSRAAGMLFDQTGNDTYNVSQKAGRNVHAQGAALLGASVLADGGGDDRYIATKGDKRPFRSQGAGHDLGFALLDDMAGTDQYTYRAANDLEGSGAQGSGTLRSVGVLVDEGLSGDTYRAGQSLVQGAGVREGVGILTDAGGDNTFSLISKSGCPQREGTTCVDGPEIPIARRSQGYAMGGTIDVDGTTFPVSALGALSAGPGPDHLHVEEVPNANNRTEEGVRSLSAGILRGSAVFVDAGGDDTYEASNRSYAFARNASAVFTDAGGTDTYTCLKNACFGYGEARSVATFIDKESGADGFTATANVCPTPEATGDLGLCLREGIS